MSEKPLSLQFEEALENYKKMPIEERFQIMVRAGQMTQEEADQAKARIRAKAAHETPGPAPAHGS